MRSILALAAASVLAAVLAAGAAGSSKATMEQAKAAGFDCAPEVLIIGYYHCTPRGKPSVLDVILGRTTAPSIVVRAFHPDGTFAGMELLLRADLLAGHVPPCPQDALPEWGLLPFGYYACHRFAT